MARRSPVSEGDAVPRFEQLSAPQHSSTATTGMKSPPSMTADDPAGPEEGETEIAAAAAGAAVVTWRTRARSTSVPAPTVIRPSRRPRFTIQIPAARSREPSLPHPSFCVCFSGDVDLDQITPDHPAYPYPGLERLQGGKAEDDWSDRCES